MGNDVVGRPTDPPIPADVLALAWLRLCDGDTADAIVRDLGISRDRLKWALLNTPIRIHRAAWLEEWLASGDPGADWAVAFLSDDEPERVAALWRIWGRRGRSWIYQDVLENNRGAIETALENMGVRVDQVAEANGWEAVHEALAHLTLDEIREQEPEVARCFRAALQRLILEDLLGAGWDRKIVPKTVPLDPVSPGLVEDEMLSVIDNRIELDAVLDRAGLTAGEREVLDLARQGWKPKEIAEQLNRTCAAVRRAKSDGIQKARDTLP